MVHFYWVIDVDYAGLKLIYRVMLAVGDGEDKCVWAVPDQGQAESLTRSLNNVLNDQRRLKVQA